MIMKYTLIFFTIVVIIACSNDNVTLETGNHELSAEYIPAIPDSTDNSKTIDPEIGDWKPGGSCSTDMTEKEE